MRSHELAPIFSTAVTMLFISSMLAEGIFAFIVIIFLHPLPPYHVDCFKDWCQKNVFPTLLVLLNMQKQ
ncbi:hypothetical protein [Phascolarctobacterium succinatutens]|uniref:hypothetical protein n=1 Tax=Phascolarctobacterium succinatutens TaxID=626940 RepID=UPI0026F33884|nr:hypothetical protein [Phascolarctobacterium succinatutens]